MNKPKMLTITNRDNETELILNHLSDENKCNFTTYAYGEVTSSSLTKTQVKQVIRWLEKWVKFKEEKAGNNLK
jgi:hypothetical protein